LRDEIGGAPLDAPGEGEKCLRQTAGQGNSQFSGGDMFVLSREGNVTIGEFQLNAEFRTKGSEAAEPLETPV
jgi:hypothetical protein